MFDISLDTANAVYGWSNVLLIIASMAVLGATIGAIWSNGIRERYSDERISKNEAETAKAKEGAALADQRAAEAKLELAKFRAPRTLPPDKRTQFIEKLKPFSGTKYDVAESDAESIEFALRIASVLNEAGWHWVDWTIPGGITTFPSNPSMGIAPHHGVAIFIYDPSLSEAMIALVDVLKTSEIDGVVPAPKEGPPSNEARKVMHIYVGTKPR